MFNTKDHADLAGITKESCAKACSEAGCAITGLNVCGHPRKGGVQRALMGNLEVLARYADACKILGVPNKHEVPL
jgi:hypothetical protein